MVREESMKDLLSPAGIFLLYEAGFYLFHYFTIKSPAPEYGAGLKVP